MLLFSWSPIPFYCCSRT